MAPKGDRAMRSRAVPALILLLSTAWASTAGADDTAAVARLKAENRRLRSELAKARQEVGALRRRLASSSQPASATRPARALEIRVEPGGWGDVAPADIQKVLLSAAGALWKHFPERTLSPIVVRHGTGGPISLYKRGRGGSYIVQLDVKGRYWCQFAYQFAHEFCHILTNYSPTAPRGKQWFEESLCEAASAYVVTQMGESWKTDPPYANWRPFASALAKYARNTRAKASDEVPPGKTLADWFHLNRAALRKDPYLRDKNRLVAKHLLRLLEADPSRWEAVGYLNRGAPERSKTLSGYLSAWHEDVPAKHRPFVRRVAGLFGVELAGR